MSLQYLVKLEILIIGNVPVVSLSFYRRNLIIYFTSTVAPNLNPVDYSVW